MELLVATTNAGKFREVSAFLKDLPLKIISLADLFDPPAVNEDGATFEENAVKKARAMAEYSGLLTLADDSGLEVDALDGAPGIYSARYAGAECDDDKNNEKLLSKLRNVSEEQRTARFVCALALCSPGSKRIPDWIVRETCEGRIAFSLRGKHGFGYDPLFFYPPMNKTFGEIQRDTKATVSHRGKALNRVAVELRDLLGISKQT
ncbi:MAG TPA: XTP/dITP diphosphatase [Candidatus Binatia bacterium]